MTLPLTKIGADAITACRAELAKASALLDAIAAQATSGRMARNDVARLRHLVRNAASHANAIGSTHDGRSR